MRSALVIAGKDLKRSVRDRSAIVTAVIAPLVLAFILSSVLGDEEQSLNVTFAVVDHDGGQTAQTFVDDVLGSLESDGVVEVVESDTVDAARDMADAGDVAAAFILPEGLSEAAQSSRPAEITVVTDPDSEIGASVAEGLAEGFASELNAARLSIAAVVVGSGPDAPPDSIPELAAEAAAARNPVSLEQQGAGSRQFDNKTFFSAGMAVFFLFFTAQLGAVSLLQERKEGTLARLMAAPISKGSIIGAKAMYGFAVGIVSMVVLIVASRFLLGASWGDPLGVAVLVLVAVFAAMGLQSLVSTLAKTDEQAAGYGAIVGVTLGLLGGTFFPLSQGPGLLSKLSFVTPHAWIMRGLGELSGGVASLADVVPSVVALVIFGAVTGALALVRSRSLVIQ